jgi:hypothetical protein
MQSVYDVYHHFCILLQADLRLTHSCFHERFHGRCAESGVGYTVARIYDTGNPQTGQMEVTPPLSAYS